MNFTPGPWVVQVEAGDEWWFGNGNQAVIRPNGGKAWDSVAVMGADEPQEIANANLIAAAPDLFDALRGLIKHIGVSAILQDIPEFNAARAAINKALGSP